MAEEDKLINVAIKYTVDGADNVKRSTAEIKADLDILSQALKSGNIDTTAVDQASARIMKDLQSMQAESRNTESAFRSLRQSGRELAQIGTFFTMAGGLIMAAAVADANNYVKAVGQTTELGREWLATENQIKEANLQIGASFAQAILPAMQEGARLLQQIANIATANPWLVSAIVTSGGIMLAIGATTRIIGELTRVIADVGLLLTKAGILQAEEQAGAGLAAGVAGGITQAEISSIVSVALPLVVLAVGAYLGFQSINDARNRALSGQEVTPPREFLYASRIAGYTGPGEAGQTAAAGASALLPNQAQAVQDFQNYQKQIATTTATYEQNRADTIAQSEQAIADATANYENQRSNIISNSEQQIATMTRDFNEQQTTALRNYNEQSAKSNRDFQIQQRNSAQSHSLEMQKLEASHNQKIADLAASRDALGIVKENQSYNAAKNQADQQFSLQRQQEIRQHAIQMADQRAAFEQQQADARAAYEQRVADAKAQEVKQLAQLDASHKIEMDKLAQQEKDKLSKLDEAYKKQMDLLKTAVIDQLISLGIYISGATQAYNNALAKSLTQLKEFIGSFSAAVNTTLSNKSIPSSTSAVGMLPGGRAVGGYASFFGPGEDGRPEYVLNNSTTRAMESMLGGRLSQANLLSSVMAGRNMNTRGGSGNNANITVTSRSLTVSEIRSEIRSAMGDMFADLIPAFGPGG